MKKILLWFEAVTKTISDTKTNFFEDVQPTTKANEALNDKNVDVKVFGWWKKMGSFMDI